MIGVLGLLLAAVGIVVALCVSGYCPRILKRLWDLVRPPPKEPILSLAARNARDDHRDRLRRYVRSRRACACELGMGPGEDGLARAACKNAFLIECIGSVLAHQGRNYLILPGGKSEPDCEGVGRTALVSKLLGLKPPYTALMGVNEQWLRHQAAAKVLFPEVGDWRLIAGDMTLLGVENGRLHAVPIVGERPNFLWDLARHMWRSTDLSYEQGAHRKDPAKRDALTALFERISCEGLDRIYVGSAVRPWPIHEVLILTRREGALGIGLADIGGRAAIEALVGEGTLVGTRQRHGSAFWDREEGDVRSCVRWVLTRMRNAPRVRELSICAPSADVPAFLYERAAEALSQEPFTVPQTIHPCGLGDLLVGVASYNTKLFEALDSVSRIRMLVTTGEKVFRDGAFWRRFVGRADVAELEILMLNPESPEVPVLEAEAYADKPPGFVKREIYMNLEAIRSVRAHLAGAVSSKRLRCFLYDRRPQLRTTILGDSRAIVSHYFQGQRTGSRTLFFDLFGSTAGEFLEALNAEYARVRETSHEVL